MGQFRDDQDIAPVDLRLAKLAIETAEVAVGPLHDRGLHTLAPDVVGQLRQCLQHELGVSAEVLSDTPCKTRGGLHAQDAIASDLTKPPMMVRPSTEGHMKVGIKVGAPIEPVSWPATLEMALAAEAAGFDSVWVEDHHLEPNGGPHDAWTAMAALAAVTERVRIGPIVASLNFERSPVVLAHRIATLHDISEGRLIMGVGSGDPDEHAMVGLASDQPVGRFVEAFEVARRLLAGERFG